MQKLASIIMLSLCWLPLPARAADNFAGLLNNKLVMVKNRGFSSYDTKKLAATKYYALYFSSHTCAPCRRFTPELITFYQDLKPKHPEFELIFVSLDDSKKSMLNYMSENQMPWPAIAYDNKQTIANLNRYRGGGIPCLVLLDAKGKILSNTFVDGQYLGTAKVLSDIETKLGKNTKNAPTPKSSPPGNGRNLARRA